MEKEKSFPEKPIFTNGVNKAETVNKPVCKFCGDVTQPAGSCRICPSCGSTTGCS